jgi:DNA polymerase-3 subunit delta
MIVTLTGTNDFWRQRELKKLVADFVAEHGDFALERLDGEEADADRLRESMYSLPFLTARKLVVLREPGIQKAFAESIAESLARVPETTDVIIVEPKLDKRLSYYKNLKKLTDFREYPELDANGLSRWAVDYAREQNATLSQTDARALIDRVGTSQQMVQQEINKLAAYSPKITKQTIELLTDRLPQSTIFELLDAAFAGKADRAMAIYDEQRALRVEPQAILAMVAWQLQIVAVVKAAGQKPSDEIAKAAKLNPFVVRKTQNITRRVSLAQVRRQVSDLLQLDAALKSMPIDADEALRLYLLKLA